ncbi:unnamed protein product [Closterium sp. NIES-54]
MVHFMVLEQQPGGNLAPKARWGLHLGVSPESKGWEVLDLTDNKVVTSVEVIFYETLSLEVWKAKFGPVSGRTQAHPPTDTSTASVPLLAKVDELADEDVVEVLPSPLVLAPPSLLVLVPLYLLGGVACSTTGGTSLYNKLSGCATAWSGRSTPPGTTPYQLLTRKKPDLTLARVWGCMVHFMVLEQQPGGNLAPKARWGLHLGVSPESKGWEVLDLTDNKVVTSVEVIFYETLSLEVWKAKFGPVSGRTQAHPPTDTSTASVPLLAKVDELADEDVVEVLPSPLVLAPPFPVTDWPVSTPVSATGDEGSLEASPVAPASGIAGGQQGAKLIDQDGKPSTTGEQQTGELSKSAGERLSFHACLPPAAFTTVYDEVDDDLLYKDAKEDEELPELNPDVHADPEHRWDIATMTVNEAMASWKGGTVKAAMEEEIRSLMRSNAHAG